MKLVAALILIAAQLSGLSHQLPPSWRAALDRRISHPETAAIGTPNPYPVYAPSALPVPISHQPLTLAADSAVAVDATTMQVLYAQNPDSQRPVASITKLATAMVILADHDPTAAVTIPALPAYSSDDAILGLTPGEVFNVRDLIQAMLVSSADDGADALALWDSGSQATFAAKMNRFLQTWQIHDTHFASPSGLTDNDNYATAASIAQLGQLALTNTLIKQVVTERNANITDTSGRSYSLKTTNDLLANPSFHGIKTGYTAAAGGCFVSIVTIRGHDVITVVLGAGDRFGTTTELVKWIGDNWQWL